jgi:hypothetical protein
VATALHGHSREAIAASTGISEGAVRQLVHRARATLRTAVTALTPWPLASWLASAPDALPSDQLGEAAVGAGGMSLAGAGLKLGALMASAAVVTGVAGSQRPVHPMPAHHRPHVAAHVRGTGGARAAVVSVGAVLGDQGERRGRDESEDRGSGRGGDDGPASEGSRGSGGRGSRGGGSRSGEGAGGSSGGRDSGSGGSSGSSGGSSSGGGSGTSGGSSATSGGDSGITSSVTTGSDSGGGPGPSTATASSGSSGGGSSQVQLSSSDGGGSDDH